MTPTHRSHDMTDKLCKALEAAANRLDWCSSKFPAGSVEAEFVNDWVKEANDALAAAPQPGNGDALSVLSGISSYLGAGMGDENTTPAEFEKRIRWGIDHHVSAIITLAADMVERLSKRPNTTWGEVKSAIIALAAAPQPSPEDREALADLIFDNLEVGCNLTDEAVLKVADALLARGLRLPGDETMAWAVLGEGGKIDPRKLWINSRDAEEYCERGERAVRVAIRVVEGGDDAA